MKKLHFRLLVSLLAGAAVLAGCSKGGGGADGEAAEGATIKIGEFASLTGKEATFGISSHEGTLMAI